MGKYIINNDSGGLVVNRKNDLGFLQPRGEGQRLNRVTIIPSIYLITIQIACLATMSRICSRLLRNVISAHQPTHNVRRESHRGVHLLQAIALHLTYSFE